MRQDMEYSSSSSASEDEQLYDTDRYSSRASRRQQQPPPHQLNNSYAAPAVRPTRSEALDYLHPLPSQSGDPYASHIYSRPNTTRDRLNQSLDTRTVGTSASRMGDNGKYYTLDGNLNGTCYDASHRNLGKFLSIFEAVNDKATGLIETECGLYLDHRVFLLVRKQINTV